jgi:hypothetical protein
VSTSFEIGNTQITPFDRLRYVQCIKNPLAGTEGIAEDEIITVQMCKPILKFKQPGQESVKHNEKDFYTVCDKSEPGNECYLEYRKAIEKREKGQTMPKCFYCEKWIKNIEFYTCKPEHEFAVC